MRRVGLSLVVLASVARFSGAQDSTALIAGDRASSAELAKIIAATQSSGLPVKPILTKISYGILMKAPAPRIIAAARGTAARLEEARNALEPHPTESDITAGENALSSNVSVKSLKDVRKVAANRPLAVPLGVLSQLVASGVEEPKAAKMVTDLLRKGVTGEMLADLGNAVNEDVQAGAKPNNSLDVRARLLTAVLGVPTTAAGTAVDAPLTAGAATPTQPGKKKP